MGASDPDLISAAETLIEQSIVDNYLANHQERLRELRIIDITHPPIIIAKNPR